MLTSGPDAVLLAIRTAPRAARSRIGGERAGRLVVYVTAPPIEGRANEAVVRLLARALKVPRGRITLLSGEHARDKLVRIEGVALAQVADRLRAAQ